MPPPVARARELRRRLTDAERILWRHLRSRRLAGAKFRRQEPVGRYVTDLCCIEHKLIVEVDGEHHAAPGQVEHDRKRTEFLERSGYRVLRFWNGEVLGELRGVLEMIQEAIEPPHPDPLPEGEGTREAESETRKLRQGIEAPGVMIGEVAVESPHPDPLPEGEGPREAESETRKLRR